MSSRIHAATHRRLVRLLAAVILAAGVVIGAAEPAVAHDELLSSDPASGSTLEAPPTQVTLTFSGPIPTDLGGTQMEVTDAAGSSLADGDPTVTDNVMSQALTGTPSGAVRVAWRIVSQDGHPISGEFSFTVDRETSPASTPGPTPQAEPSPSATPVAAEQVSPVPGIVLGAVVIAAVTGVVYLLVARGRGRPTPPAAPSPDR